MAKQIPLHPSSPDMIKIDKDLWKFGDYENQEGSHGEKLQQFKLFLQN